MRSWTWLLYVCGAILSGTIVYEVRGQTQKTYARQFRDGDILIGGAFEVHRHPSTGTCGELRAKGVEDVETINMLIDQVNANDTILRGVKLGSVMIDTCAWPFHAVQRIVHDIVPLVHTLGNCSSNTAKRRVLAGALGAGTSKVSLQMANLLQVFYVSQISHSATNQDLSDKTNYPYFFRTVPPDPYQTRAMIQLAKEMKWNYVSVVFANNCYGRNAYLEFTTLAKKAKICIAVSLSVPKSPTDADYKNMAMKLLKNKKAKVVILYTTSTPAEKVISAAHSLSNGTNRLLWIGSDGWASYLPKVSTDASYVDSLDGVVAFSLYGSHQSSVDEYMTNITLGQREGNNFSINPWFSELLASQKGCSLKSTGNSSTKVCKSDDKLPSSLSTYNGLFNLINAFKAYIYAIDLYHRQICKNESGFCKAMSDLSGTNKLALAIYPILKNISFPLSNGELFFFDKNQDGPPKYNIVVYNKTNVKDPKQQRQGWAIAGTFKNGSISWINGVPWKAQTTESICSKKCGRGEETIKEVTVCCWTCIACQKAQYVSPNTSRCTTCPLGQTSSSYRNSCVPLPIESMNYTEIHSALPLALGMLGIIFTIAVTIVYIIHKDSPIIRASGTELCFFVLFGILLTLCNSFVLTLRATTASCIVSRIILSIGPTMMYAGLLVKTIRVVIIFKYKTNLPRKLESSLLPFPQIMIAFGFVSIQVIVLIVWFIVYKAEPWIKYDAKAGYLSCPGQTKPMIFIGLLYPLVLIVACTVFATVNRKVPTGFNETLLVGFSMYTTSVIWIAFLTLFNVNASKILLKVTTTSICLSLSALTVLCCLFGPRCYKVLFRPDENTRNAVMSNPRTLQMSTAYQDTGTELRKHSDLGNNTSNECLNE